MNAPLQHRVLPPLAQDVLRRAAQTPVTDADPLARVKAIEKAAQRLRHQYPDYFRKD